MVDNKNSIEYITSQIKSVLVFEFLDSFNQFEEYVHSILEKNIKELPPKTLNKLYFYYGGRISTSVDSIDQSIKLNSIKYDEKETFKQLTTNQIIRTFKNDNCIKDYDFQIESIKSKTVFHDFYSCAIKLINMRNKLAHELKSCSFGEGELIELISIEKIRESELHMLDNFDISRMDNMSQHIASNLIYLNKILKNLQKSLL